MYGAEFEDGEATAISANTAAANLYDHHTDGGNKVMLLKHILDHKSSDKAICKADGNNKRDGHDVEHKKIIRVWQSLVEWVDGSMTWERLADLKESFPSQVAEYANGNEIIGEPAFA